MNIFPMEGGYAVVVAGGIVLGAFLSEDAATNTAAALAASRMLDARLAFLSAFAGLWLGDMAMYGRLEWWGRRLLNVVGLKLGSTLGLALSRFIPGTRLPACISAGLEGMPIPAFALITAISATVWILFVFATIHLVPVARSDAQHELMVLSALGLVLGTSNDLASTEDAGQTLRPRGSECLRGGAALTCQTRSKARIKNANSQHHA